MTREEAKAVVEKLVNRFAEQRNGYHAADYNETKTRRDFIDPLFTAFGWDMDNKDDVAEPYREVIHEDKVKIQGKTKAPDYGFRLSGSKDRLFFVEAKKPSVSLKTNKESAFQVRRYGWNSGASVSILTNFEEFSIYDCSKKPSATESSTVARLKYFTYDQLLKEFDFFYDIFSREAVVKGRFDNYIKSDTAKKGTQTPDKEFVVSLDKWRKFIAIDIAKSNLKLNEDDLNFAVQLIIDRLIFLRFCEDRGVENYGQLKTSVSKGDAYKNLCSVFKDADNKYNSGLFDFKKDRITQELKVTNKIIKGIVEDLYSPNCEYDFKALPVEVLGNAYEQFLGKVIRINKAHHAVIEEKPEVRKAGGVYYTPEYIVDHIVENTLGKLIAGKTPKEIEKIKIVDPACGSGSFLLGAFQYLLNYHANYYHENGFATKKTKDNPLTPFGTLSTAEKKKILLNNIYGVDIDANAVEVTKLSLLLKCMEGETDASIKQQFNMFHERVLPDLDNNIKDGNSLVGTDFYDEQIDLGYEKKIKPYSWKKGFPTVFKQGGFDVLIGNPPYHSVKDMDTEQKDYFYKKYQTGEGRFNLFSLFIEKAFDLLHNNGLFGFIIPNSFTANSQYQKLRKFILEHFKIGTIINFDDGVFKDARVETLILTLAKESDKNQREKNKFEIVYDIPIAHKMEGTKKTKPQLEYVNNIENVFSIKPEIKLNWSKLFKLEEICDIKNGINPGNIADKIIVDKKTSNFCKKIADGKDIQRYEPVKWRGQYVIYDVDFVEKLRRDLAKKGISWTARIIKNENYFEQEKLVIQRIRNLSLKQRLVLTYDQNGFYTTINVGVILKNGKSPYDLKFILGILNSNFMNVYYASRFHNIQIKNEFLAELPIPKLDLSNKKNKSNYDLIIAQVNTILELSENYHKEKIVSKQAQIKQRVEYAQEKIEQIVYELYELSVEDIKMVEGGNS